MSDQEPATRLCSLCKESIGADALRCEHCQAPTAPAGPMHHGTCPYCKEAIHLEAIRCKHCRANFRSVVLPGGRQAHVLPGPAGRRSYRRLESARDGVTWATLQNLSPVEPRDDKSGCPDAIIDSSPDGSGLGVWLLLWSDEKTCTYEYDGGII